MATTKFIDIKVRTKSAEANVERLDRKTKSLGREADKTASAFSNLSKVAIAIGSSLAVSQITKYADAFTSLQNQLRQTVNTTSALDKVTNDLLNVANRSRTEFQATAELYTQLNLSTENLNLSTEELLRLTETIGKSFAVSGKSAAESAGAIRQLGQAFSAGALRGDEFNSIAEGAPEIMRALQRELGKTQGELRDFAATGGITAKILVEALGGAAEVIDGKMDKAVKTLNQSLQEANNNLTDFIGSSTTVQNVIGGAGGALVSASESIEVIANSAVILASVFAARLIPSMITYTSSVIANTQAQLLNGTTAIRTANVYGVVSVAQARATVTTNALTLASRALSVSMAFLGGPLGIALIAAVALITLSDSIEDVGEKSTLSASEVDEFTASINGLTRSTKAKLLGDINNEMAEVREKIIEASNAIEFFRKQGLNAIGRDASDNTKRIQGFKDEVIALNGQLDVLSEKQGIIIGGPDLSGGTERGDISKESTKASGAQSSAFANSLAAETEQLRIELELRKSVREGFLSEESAAEAARFIASQAQQQARLDAELVKIGDDELAKEAILLQFREQQMLSAEEFQQNLTDIEAEAVADRIAEAQKEAQAKQQLNNQLLGTAVSFGSALLKNQISNNAKSEKEKKRARKKGVIIDTAAGISLAFATMPYPAAVAAAIAIGATGLANLATISSASGVSTPQTASVSSTPVATRPTTQTVTNQTRAVDIRIPDNALLTGSMFREALSTILQTDDDIILDINNSQSELSRVGG